MMDNLERTILQLEDQQQDLAKSQATIEDSLEKLQTSVEAIRKALLGDEMTGEGWIPKMKKLQERVDKIEKFFDRFKYFFIGTTLASGYGLFELLRKFLLL